MRYKSHIIRLALAVAGASLFYCPASAGSVDLHPIPWADNEGGRLVTVRLSQGIDIGDLDLVKKAIRKARKAGKEVVALEMNSWGGDGYTSVDIANYVRDTRIPVYIDAECKSGCAFPVLMALAHSKLIVGPFGRIALHQAYEEKRDGRRIPDLMWTQQIARQFLNDGMRREPVEAMLAQEPEGFTWFDADDLVEWGAVQTGSGWQYWVNGW
jgi:hypothetical protein